MEVRTVVVICSSRPAHLKISLACAASQSVSFAKVIVVAWGSEVTAVVRETARFERVEAVRGPISGPASVQRNIGLERIRSLRPTHVAFVDDDTFLSEKWHERVLQTAARTDERCSVGSTVVFASDRGRVQSNGHTFSDYRPLDIAYGLNVDDEQSSWTTRKKTRGETFDCVCANCAFIPWRALKLIRDIDGSYWDERFPRLTCFEIGFKMYRLGFGYVTAPGAFAAHDGYLHRQDLRKENVQEQLLSRILLYRKFLPIAESTRALADLEQRVVRWAVNKYPHSRLAGHAVIQAYSAAVANAERHKFDGRWTRTIK